MRRMIELSRDSVYRIDREALYKKVEERLKNDEFEAYEKVPFEMLLDFFMFARNMDWLSNYINKYMPDQEKEPCKYLKEQARRLADRADEELEKWEQMLCCQHLNP
ncbi:MAG: hypothetical protein HUJ72_01760 [Blautia sp.]|nr:hypothetical protein [Blautia sp.]